MSDTPVYSIAAASNQPFNLTDRFNVTFTVTLADVDYYRNYGIVSSIIYASQVGACFAVLVILLMLTKVDKRKSPVFILNSSALLFNTVGAIMQCLYFTGPWFSPYVYLSGDYLAVPNYAKRISIAPGAFIILVTIAVEASLVLQLNVVCVTLRPIQRLAVTIVSMSMAVIAISFRIAQVALNAECNIEDASRCVEYVWVAEAMTITTTISICFFSLAFCAKLGFSLFQRRQMGLTQFGPMQIIFIGGFQTLLIPGKSPSPYFRRCRLLTVLCAAIFSILQFAHTIPEISSNILTVTAISLPLSSLWAAASIKKPSAGARGPDAHRKFLVDASTSGSTMGGTRNKSIGEAYGAGRSAGDYEKGKVGVLSSVTNGSVDEGSPRAANYPSDILVRKDLEMQELHTRS